MQLPTTRYAATPDGTNVAYQLFGDGGLPLLIVHAWISHVEVYWEWHGFRLLATSLGRKCRVAHFDKRGIGLSDRLVFLPTFEARIDDILAVVDAVGWDRTALWGYGDGGALAAAFAAAHPDRVRAHHPGR